jgi:hypothetical protein
MSETIIPAKLEHRIYLLSDNGQSLECVDVIGWAVGNGPPIPITPFGRVDMSKEYVLSVENGWLAVPSGETFFNAEPHKLQWFLQARRRG